MFRQTVRRRGLAIVMTTLVVVLGACSSSSTPAPAASGAAPGGASTGGAFCSGVNLVFFPGGTQGGGFETVVYNGAKAAQAALGPNVTYQWSDWDPNKMITQFTQAMATKPDGIAVMGHTLHRPDQPLLSSDRRTDVCDAGPRLRRCGPSRRRCGACQRGDRSWWIEVG